MKLSPDGKTLIEATNEDVDSNGTVSISNSVTEISDAAFYECSNLTYIIIPNSVTTIGESAFSRCRNLTQVIIPNSVTTIGNSAFYGCSKLIQVIIPHSVKKINAGTFSDCTHFTQITISDSTWISPYAFDGDTKLKNIVIQGDADKAKKLLCPELYYYIISNDHHNKAIAIKNNELDRLCDPERKFIYFFLANISGLIPKPLSIIASYMGSSDIDRAEETMMSVCIPGRFSGWESYSNSLRGISNQLLPQVKAHIKKLESASIDQQQPFKSKDNNRFFGAQISTGCTIVELPDEPNPENSVG